MEKSLYFILFFYYLYINALLIYTFRKRKTSVIKGEVSLSHFKDYRSGGTEELSILQNHINNQFQVPILFFITVLAAIQANVADSITLALAIAFVLSRMLHTYIHLGSNHVVRRAMAYASGLIVLLLIWMQIVVTSL